MSKKNTKSRELDWRKRLELFQRPPEANEILLRRMEEDDKRLFNFLLVGLEGSELVTVCRRLLADSSALAFRRGLERGHQSGFRNGFWTAQKLEKLTKKKIRGYKAEIVKIILRHPGWTAQEIYTELDFRKVKFERLGNAPRHAEYWSDVVKEPSYKMLVTRARQQVIRLMRGQAWGKILELEAKVGED